MWYTLKRNMERNTLLIASCNELSNSLRFQQWLSILEPHFDIQILSTDTNETENKRVYWFYNASSSKLALLLKRIAFYTRFKRISEYLDLKKLKSNLTKRDLKDVDLILVLDLSLIPLFKKHLNKVVFDSINIKIKKSENIYYDKFTDAWLGHFYFSTYVNQCALVFCHTINMRNRISDMLRARFVYINNELLHADKKSDNKNRPKRIKRFITILTSEHSLETIEELAPFISIMSPERKLTIIAPHDAPELLKALVSFCRGKHYVSLTTKSSLINRIKMLSEFDYAIYFPTNDYGSSIHSPLFYDLIIARLIIISVHKNGHVDIFPDAKVTDNSIAGTELNSMMSTVKSIHSVSIKNIENNHKSLNKNKNHESDIIRMLKNLIENEKI